ncbi:hypothetical protein BJX66DRAFT_244993 [Aspergillus keveii]|uniref:Uncharacterized protein n=1 Tax=Aspergillus keveii TaxID=714993 RepID=A0ABR4G0F5_9EURO
MRFLLSLSYDMTKTVLYYDDMPRYDLDLCPCHAYATLMPRHALFLLTLRFGLDFYTSRLVCCTSLRVYCTFIASHLHLYLRCFLYQYSASLCSSLFFYPELYNPKHSGYCSTHGKSSFNCFFHFTLYNNGTSSRNYRTMNLVPNPSYLTLVT